MKKFLAVIVSVMLMILAPISTSVSALTDEQMYIFSQNNILFYDPSGGCTMMAGGNNYNYEGQTILSDAELQAIAANQPFYEKAANEYGFAWQILAAIHYREHRLIRDNPTNGQGAYQLYSYTNAGKNENAFLPAGAISDTEFQRQTDIAAKLIAENYASGLDLSSDGGVKKLFYRYNGTGNGIYTQQGLALGFSQEEAENGEGSPYVMNRFDLERDPTVEPTKSNNTWGQFKVDATGSLEYPANSDFGAFVVYVALGGSSVICNGGRLVSGGMSLAEAQEFMEYYINVAKENEFLTRSVELDGAILPYFSDCRGALTNCVALSRWFVARYTSINDNPVSANGGVLAATMANAYNLELNEGVPQVYSVFSCSKCSTSAYGHTGVILGIDEEAGTVVYGEAGCGAGVNFIQAREKPLSQFMTDDYKYVYLQPILVGVGNG